MITSRTLSPLYYQLQLPNQRKILAIYALTLLMYTVASPDRNQILGEGVNYLTLRVQFYSNECDEEETLTPNPDQSNSTLMSGTKNIYPYPYS